MATEITRVLATGVFNILHPGHIFFLEEARKLGDELVVIVASDKIASRKKAGFVLPQEQRARVIESLRCVDRVYIGDEENQLKLLPKIKPDIIALGYDQNVNAEELQQDLTDIGLKARIVRIAKMPLSKFASTREIIRMLCGGQSP